MVRKDADITGGIVVGHDGSRAAGAVVRRAGDLARRLGVTLHVVRVWNVTTAPRPDSMVGGYVPPFAEFEQAVVADLKADWNFYMAYNLFRIAAILQGIIGRVRDGTATSEFAPAKASMIRPLAEKAMEFAKQAGA